MDPPSFDMIKGEFFGMRKLLMTTTLSGVGNPGLQRPCNLAAGGQPQLAGWMYSLPPSVFRYVSCVVPLAVHWMAVSMNCWLIGPNATDWLLTLMASPVM
jgi:hypothetical protein